MARIDVAVNRIVGVGIDAELDLQVFDARRNFEIEHGGHTAEDTEGLSSQRRDAGHQR